MTSFIMTTLKKFYKDLATQGHVVTRLLLAFLILLLGGVIAISINVQTATAGPGQPFGGMSTFVFNCTCSANFAIYFNDLTIAPAIVLPLIYQPGGTILYPNFNILSAGTWILGTWQAGGQCRYWVGKVCVVLPTAGTMYMVGTS